MTDRYPPETSDDDLNDVLPGVVGELADAVIGHRIVQAERVPTDRRWTTSLEDLVITLDNGTRVRVVNSDDCCAFTELRSFWLHPEHVNHVILGVGTTGEYATWHIYADLGDILALDVAWSAGNGYYGYGFHIQIEEIAT